METMPAMLIDTSFDFRTDTPAGKDPDTHSKTLRRYHKELWSKPLPRGVLFTLNDNVRGHYLHHSSQRGQSSLTSDSVIPTFTRWGFAAEHPELFTQAENASFMSLAYTIGGMMVFPGDRRDGKWTMNQARGCHRRIADRMDLTLECIRRHYAGEDSPLGKVLARYDDFFALFEDFSGYVDFFLLQDLVSSDKAVVTFFMPFDGFRSPAVPKDADTYSEYRRRSRELADLLDRRPPEETTRGRSSDLRDVGAERPGARGDVVEAKAHAAACCT